MSTMDIFKSQYVDAKRMYLVQARVLKDYEDLRAERGLCDSKDDKLLRLKNELLMEQYQLESAGTLWAEYIAYEAQHNKKGLGPCYGVGRFNVLPGDNLRCEFEFKFLQRDSADEFARSYSVDDVVMEKFRLQELATKKSKFQTVEFKAPVSQAPEPVVFSDMYLLAHDLNFVLADLSQSFSKGVNPYRN